MDDDAAVKHAMGVAIQNSVIKLPAAAVRAGMFDVHVIVEMLPSLAHEQTVNQAFAALARQHRVNIVTHQSTTQQKRVRSNVGAALLLNAQGGNVKGINVFAFDHVV